jgi:hypothetical protein
VFKLAIIKYAIYFSKFSLLRLLLLLLLLTSQQTKRFTIYRINKYDFSFFLQTNVVELGVKTS